MFGKLFMRMSKIKYFLRNYSFLFLALTMAGISFFSLIKTWLPVKEAGPSERGGLLTGKNSRTEIQLPVQSAKEKAVLQEKIKQTLSNSACDLRKETLVKGYVKEIVEDGLAIGDYKGKDEKIKFSSPVLFLRVFYKESGEEMAQEEISREEIKALDDVVILAFPDKAGEIETPLVKKIIMVD